MATVAPAPALDLRGRYERYEALFAGRDDPFAFVDLDAMWANARDMLHASRGKPDRACSLLRHTSRLQRTGVTTSVGSRMNGQPGL